LNAEKLVVQINDFVIVYKIVTDCIVTGCPQNKKNEGKGILLLDFELFIGAYKALFFKNSSFFIEHSR
jgi:hypothetical protein